MPKKRFGSGDDSRAVSTADLLRIAESYSRELTGKGIDHALIGGLAVGLYGRVRATKDIDFLISSVDVDKIAGELLGGEVEGVTFKREGVRIDLLFPPYGMQEDLDLALFSSRSKELPVPLIPLPALILLKLHAGRARDQGDVVELLKRTGAAKRRNIRNYVKHIRPDLADEFDSAQAEADLEAD